MSTNYIGCFEKEKKMSRNYHHICSLSAPLKILSDFYFGIYLKNAVTSLLLVYYLGPMFVYLPYGFLHV